MHEWAYTSMQNSIFDLILHLMSEHIRVYRYFLINRNVDSIVIIYTMLDRSVRI